MLFWWAHSFSTAGHTDARSVCVSNPHPHLLVNKGTSITANNYMEHTEIIIIIIITRKLIMLVVQRPHDIRYWIDPLTAGFKDEVKWWSGMELGRRLLFLLFIVSFPKNTVSNNDSIIIIPSIIDSAEYKLLQPVSTVFQYS